MEWTLKSKISLVENIPFQYFAEEYSKPWTVKDKKPEASAHQEFDDEWDFDGGTILETANSSKPNEPSFWQYSMDFLGFHPYKEIAFFHLADSRPPRAVSYHLNTSKVQELGPLSLPESRETTFPYTACWMRDLFENN
jgi:hypothetical protein